MQRQEHCWCWCWCRRQVCTWCLDEDERLWVASICAGTLGSLSGLHPDSMATRCSNSIPTRLLHHHSITFAPDSQLLLHGELLALDTHLCTLAQLLYPGGGVLRCTHTCSTYDGERRVIPVHTYAHVSLSNTCHTCHKHVNSVHRDVAKVIWIRLPVTIEANYLA